MDRIKILIIDDDVNIRKTLKKLLLVSGYDVCEAQNGKVGLDLFRENNVDLVITDMLMPEKSGAEVIMELKTEYPDVKIIAMSGYGDELPDEFMDLPEGLNADSILPKPFRLHELQSTIKNTLLTYEEV